MKKASRLDLHIHVHCTVYMYMYIYSVHKHVYVHVLVLVIWLLTNLINMYFTLPIVLMDLYSCALWSNSFSSGPTADIPSRKKSGLSIVQQTIGITDNVAVHQCVHYRPLYPLL